MLNHAEVVTLILGSFLCLFLATNRAGLRRLPAVGWPLTAVGFLMVGWLATILEGYLLHQWLNLLEHLAYAAASLTLAGWVWQLFARRRHGTGRPAR